MVVGPVRKMRTAETKLSRVCQFMEDCMAASTLTSGFIKKFPPKIGKLEELKQHQAETGLPSPHTRIPGDSPETATEGPSKEDLAILETWHQYRADPSRQDLRNRLVERYMPLVRLQRRTNLGSAAGRCRIG